MEKQEFLAIIDNYLSGRATPLEEQMLINFFESHQKTTAWSGQLHGPQQQALAEVYSRLQAAMRESNQSKPPVHRIHFLKTAWFRYAAAVIIILGTGIYLFNTDRPVGANNYSPLPRTSIINTKNNKATLTLADGTQITLDNTANGNIAQQGNTKIIKLDAGQLSYTPAAGADVLGVAQPIRADEAKASYNTLTTPRGGQYQLTLPDGSKVWLNAASSITYPVAFTGKKREVSVSGEAYFEVKPVRLRSGQAKMPFTVNVNNQLKIDVLGTSFNINAYKEASSFKTSLLEGSVKVILRLRSGLDKEAVLTPGQAYTNAGVTSTNLQQDIAWKNGVFNFTDVPLTEAMNQLARWYDLEIVYQGNLPTFDFYGEIARNLPLSDVLTLLSGMRGVDLRLEGKKLIVSAQ